MTCIVGIEHDGHVYLGGDSAAADDWSILQLSEPKVFKVGNIVLGYCGSIRIGQLLQYGLALPEPTVNQSDMSYLTLDVIDAIRACLHGRGSLRKENEVEETADSTNLLLGYKGKLYYVDYDLHVGRSRDGYYAIGSGMHIALGSLFTTEKYDISPEERIKLALEAAENLCPGVKGPFTVIRLRGEAEADDDVEEVDEGGEE